MHLLKFYVLLYTGVNGLSSGWALAWSFRIGGFCSSFAADLDKARRKLSEIQLFELVLGCESANGNIDIIIELNSA